MNTSEEVRRGHEAFERRQWRDAFERLSAADRAGSLEPESLEMLAVAAFLIGRDDVQAEVLSRAHHHYLDSSNIDSAVRCAFWLGFGLMHKGQHAQASGWFARANRLLDDAQRDSVERGYLLLPVALRHVGEGHMQEACGIFTEAARIGARFGDADLTTLGRQGQGRTTIALGRIAEGVALLDEVMIAATAGEVSPIIVGTLYCSVIEACYEMFDLRRAHEWTAALTTWCASQPDLVPYRGHCLVRRAEIMQLHGEWPDAMEEALRACETLSQPSPHPSRGAAFYQRAELHRLRGEFADAEEAYRLAAQSVRKALPGLAQLRLAQGQADVAMNAICRVMEEARDPRTRPRILAACVEIALAAGDRTAARNAADELMSIAAGFESPFLNAVANQSQGAVKLAEGDAAGALALLRLSWTVWEEFEAAYEIARVRTLVGVACRMLGDVDAATIEFDAARATLMRLQAAPDLARLDDLVRPRDREPAPLLASADGLTVREVEVLKLIASGRTNRAIADELAISEKTVARHISNIFTKLDLSNRAAATAYAFKHGITST